MKTKGKLYLYEGKVWRSDDKMLNFTSLSEPDKVIKYTSLHPDQEELFKEIVPNEATYVRDSPQERLYRVLTDLSTVIFLNEDSFRDISKNVLAYLEEIEEFERMCVVRDITEFYTNNRKKRNAEIDNYVKKHDKPAAKGES